jgi:hypothetical protein
MAKDASMQLDNKVTKLCKSEEEKGVQKQRVSMGGLLAMGARRASRCQPGPSGKIFRGSWQETLVARPQLTATGITDAIATPRHVRCQQTKIHVKHVNM